MSVADGERDAKGGKGRTYLRLACRRSCETYLKASASDLERMSAELNKENVVDAPSSLARRTAPPLPSPTVAPINEDFPRGSRRIRRRFAIFRPRKCLETRQKRSQ